MATYRGCGGPSRFSSWLQSMPTSCQPLAWCHSTDAYAFRGIIEDGAFSPNDCPVFEEPLSYCFYGRPAYRCSDTLSMLTNARAPVVILFDPILITCRKRIFPFDTGAFHKDRYARWMHKSMGLHDFELTNLTDAPQRYVSSFFGSNYNYLTLNPNTPPTDSYAGHFEVDVMVSMLRDQDACRADDRRLALEMQVQEPIPFQASFVKGLILPQSIRHASYVENFISGAGAGIDIRTYDAAPLKLARDYQVLLEQYARDLQQEWGII